ncbi:MAG: FAD:protein FMN transferase [Flavobacteriales bacterium]
MQRIFIALSLLILLLSSCSELERKEARGYTQGTTYSVIYYNNGADLQYQIDSLLLSFDRVLSTYQETSYISKWNRNEQVPMGQPAEFKEVVKKASEIYDSSEGAFDITVSPLMKYWFEQDWNTVSIDSVFVDSLQASTGMANVVLEGDDYVKLLPSIQLDVNAIAQGYSVDVVSRYLESEGIFNYLVEIGGEIRASGTKPNQELWSIGIDKPSAENVERQQSMSITVQDKALATSGNYRKFVEIDGQRFGHSLNPVTGYPAKTDVLSATVIANDCMTADAYATALMVMGYEESMNLLTKKQDLGAVLIYSEGSDIKTWVSSGIMESVVEN